MISTGNDIIALGSINKQRTNEFRFYSRILSASEQVLYQQPEFADMPFENYVWLLWSVKESAYKYLKRLSPGLVFSPVKITLTNLRLSGHLFGNPDAIRWDIDFNNNLLYIGKINFGANSLYFQSMMNDKYISSVVNDSENFETVCWGTHSIGYKDYDYQSQAVRNYLLKHLRTFIGDNIEVGKSTTGYPLILKNKQYISLPASLSHHGYFVSYSFKIA